MATSEWTTLSLVKNAAHREQFSADLRDKASDYLESLMQWSKEEASRLYLNNVAKYPRAYAVQAVLLRKILRQRKEA